MLAKPIRMNGRKSPALRRTFLAVMLGAVGLLPWTGCASAATGERAKPDAGDARDPSLQAQPSPLDATFTIMDRKFRLTGGRYEEPAGPGSALREVIRVVGKPVFGDLDGDGTEDAALILAYSGGGSGTFYYAAAAIVLGGAYEGTNGLFLGDRIVPRSLEIRNGVLEVGYLDRRPDQPLAAVPKELRIKRLTMIGGVLEEIKLP